MNKPWYAEYEVSSELASDLINQQFSQLKITKISLLGKGWDNIAFLINAQYVFRFPRRKIAVELLESEIKLLPYLADKLPINIPQPQFIGTPTKSYPWPFAGYLKLPGITACQIHLTIDTRINNAEKLAKFLLALHNINVEEAKYYGAVNDRLGRVDPNLRVPMAMQNLDALDKYNIFDTYKLKKYLENFSDNLVKTPYCLTHGDLYVRHLLINEQRKLTGIIDWGDVEIGHPAIDLSIAHSFLPPSAHDLFRQVYGEINNETWELARLRGIFSASTLVIYGHDIHDKNLIREGLVGLNFISQAL